MKPVVAHTDAESEIEEAAAYYESRQKGLGGRLRRDFEQALWRVAVSPGLSPRFEETGYRFHVLRRFPYVLFYEELNDRIHILAFAHARRRPGYWLDRVAE